MRKIYSVILIIFMMLTLIACQKEQKNITLCDYMNLTAEKINYEVREEEKVSKNAGLPKRAVRYFFCAQA